MRMTGGKLLDVSAAVGSLLTRAGLVACRPTGLKVVLNKSGYLINAFSRNNDYARLQVGDLCAGDWTVEELEAHRPSNGEAA